MDATLLNLPEYCAYVQNSRLFPFVKADGGRANAGFRGIEGDCVVRAICNVTGKDYAKVYSECSALNAAVTQADIEQLGASGANLSCCNRIMGKANCANGVLITPAFHAYARLNNLHYLDLSGRVELSAYWGKADRLMVRLYGHVTAVVGGAIFDSFDPQEDAQTYRYGSPGAWVYLP